MSPLIDVNEVTVAAQNGAVLIDARGGADSYQRYLAGHLPGAQFVDLDKDLAAKPENAAFGGRHPLPAPADFAQLLGRLGITPDTHVIIYDDKAAANPAARLWWMLRAIGHKQVQVINGGLQAAVDAGITLSTEPTEPNAPTTYPAPEHFVGTVDLEEVQQAVKDTSRMVIDVRETPRYLGHTEPLDLVAGHIPGAVNLPYIQNLDGKGNYLPADKLKVAYLQLFGQVAPEDVVVHCGSGVTACHTLLGMEHAGITGPKLYVGSWSEWSRRDLPIGTEAHPEGQ